MYLCVGVCVCILVGIERLMPKRKFPEFCEGLLRQAGIKIVCVCVWWTVLVAVVGGRMIAFWKRRLGHTVCFSLISLVPALRLS